MQIDQRARTFDLTEAAARRETLQGLLDMRIEGQDVAMCASMAAKVRAHMAIGDTEKANRTEAKAANWASETPERLAKWETALRIARNVAERN